MTRSASSRTASKQSNGSPGSKPIWLERVLDAQLHLLLETWQDLGFLYQSATSLPSS